jgi:hypothetical protein
LKRYKGIFLAHFTFYPSAAAGFAFFMTPHIVADINTLIFFNPFIADVTVIFFELMEEGFLEIFLL